MSRMRRVLGFWNLENIKVVRRTIVSVIGATVLLIGIALRFCRGRRSWLFTMGLAILAMEYAWARHWLKRARRIASWVISARDAPNRNR